MPTYDYVCRNCGHAFELFQSMTDSVKRKCPECSQLRLERLIGTGAGVIFKGGGFYETDYRSDSYKKAAEAEKKSAEPKDSKSTDTKSNGKTDSQSAGKPEKKSKKSASPKSSKSTD